MSDRSPVDAGRAAVTSADGPKAARLPSDAAAANLLFGLLALHNGFITRDDLVAATSVWLEDKSKSIQDILVARGVLSDEDRRLVAALVSKHLKQHDNNPRKSLAELTSLASVRKELDSLDDRDIESSLSLVGGGDRYETISLSPTSSISVHRRFRALYLHAKGGLGEIFVAQDEELDRQVALKQIQSTHADNELSRVRFVQEAEVTGKLEHPGIVPVYGRGADDGGRPFYAMRFIKGHSLRQEILLFHEHHEKAWRTGKARIALRSLLRRFVDVCNTVEYAHNRGVLHRDLKPANVMLGKFGETLIVDWGLAKMVHRLRESEETSPDEPSVHVRETSDSAPTRQGTTLGTLGYMSPEQAAGRIEEMGPCSDVYSLGAILYCLLTGRSSQDLHRDMQSILASIQEGSFPRPRKLKPQIPRPLESICLRSMAVDPKTRYPSSRELAEDIERWMADERVLAHRENATEKLFRLARRHRGWVGAAIAVFAISACSLIAVLALRDADRNRREAISNFVHAQEAIDTWYTLAADDLQDVPAFQGFRERLLQRAADDYEDLVRNASGNPDVEVERGRTLVRLGDIRDELGETEAAGKYFTDAKEVFEKLLTRSESNRDARLGLASTYLRLGDVSDSSGDAQEAQSRYTAAMEVLEAPTGSSPQDGRYEEALGTCLLKIGLIQLKTTGFQQAEEALRASIREFNKALDLETENPHFLRGLSSARAVFGEALRGQNRLAEAERFVKEAIDTTDELVRRFPERRDLLVARAEARAFLAAVSRDAGRYSEELQVTQDNLDDYRTLAAQYPGVVRYVEDVSRHLMDLGQIRHLLGQSRQAESDLKEALTGFEGLVAQNRLIPRYREELAACLGNLCQVLSSLNRNQEALDYGYRAANELSWLANATTIREGRTIALRFAILQSDRAQASYKSGQPDEAALFFEDSVSMVQRLRDARGGDTDTESVEADALGYLDTQALVSDHWATFLWSRDQKDAAREKIKAAYEMWTEIVADTDRTIPEVQHHFARFLTTCVERQPHFANKAIEMAGLAQARAPRNADYTSTLGAAHYRAGDHEEAKDWLEKAIDLRQDANAFDLFFLAMAESETSMEDAKKSYVAGQTWLDEKQPGNTMLQRLAQETRKTLGLPEPDPDPAQAARSPSVE